MHQYTKSSGFNSIIINRLIEVLISSFQVTIVDENLKIVNTQRFQAIHV